MLILAGEVCEVIFSVKLGELAEAFENGGQVTKGQLLLSVDASDATAARDIAVTDLAEAKADLAQAKMSLELAELDLSAAEEQVELRVVARVRAEELFERRIGTEAALESAILAEASAKQSVISRKQAVAQSEAQIEQATNALARREIALADAERRLDETDLHAEFSGQLSNVSVVKGGLVQNNEQLADLIDPTALEVSFRISTAEYARLLDDQNVLMSAKVDVVLDVLGADLTVFGEISRESPVVGEGQSGRLVFARLDDANGLRPGDFVTVRIAEPELQFAVELPAASVDAAGEVLVLGEEDRLSVAVVDVLRRQGDNVIVRSRDLRGKEIVAARSPLLGAGIKVRPIREDDSTEPEAPAMVELTDERRAKLVAFVEGNKRMPADAKKRVLSTLEQPQVPAQMVERMESRMGG